VRVPVLKRKRPMNVTKKNYQQLNLRRKHLRLQTLPRHALQIPAEAVAVVAGADEVAGAASRPLPKRLPLPQ